MPPDAPSALPAAAPAAVPIVTVAPAVAAPAVSPAPAAVPVVADVPAAVAAPAVETPVGVDPAAAAPAVEPAPGAEPTAAVVDPPVVEAPKVDGEAEVAPVVVAPKYEFKMPENVKMDAVQLGAFTGILAEHNIPPEVGQKFIDLGATLVKAQVDAVMQGQVDAFAETRAGWVKEVAKFGNQRDTIVNDAIFAITDTIKDAKERKAVFEVLGMTGAGDNPVFIKAMAKLGKRMREGAAPPADLPANGAKNGSPADRRYGGKTA